MVAALLAAWLRWLRMAALRKHDADNPGSIG
jgi:hypothetical protein